MIFFISHWGEIPPIGIKLEQIATATTSPLSSNQSPVQMSENLLQQVDNLRQAASQEWEAKEMEIQDLRRQIVARIR